VLRRAAGRFRRCRSLRLFHRREVEVAGRVFEGQLVEAVGRGRGSGSGSGSLGRRRGGGLCLRCRLGFEKTVAIELAGEAGHALGRDREAFGPRRGDDLLRGTHPVEHPRQVELEVVELKGAPVLGVGDVEDRRLIALLDGQVFSEAPRPPGGRGLGSCTFGAGGFRFRHQNPEVGKPAHHRAVRRIVGVDAGDACARQGVGVFSRQLEAVAGALVDDAAPAFGGSTDHHEALFEHEGRHWVPPTWGKPR
jgi:hypothetical protein